MVQWHKPIYICMIFQIRSIIRVYDLFFKAAVHLATHDEEVRGYFSPSSLSYGIISCSDIVKATHAVISISRFAKPNTNIIQAGRSSATKSKNSNRSDLKQPSQQGPYGTGGRKGGRERKVSHRRAISAKSISTPLSKHAPKIA